MAAAATMVPPMVVAEKAKTSRRVSRPDATPVAHTPPMWSVKSTDKPTTKTPAIASPIPQRPSEKVREAQDGRHNSGDRQEGQTSDDYVGGRESNDQERSRKRNG